MVDAKEQPAVVPSVEPPQEKPADSTPVIASAETPSLATPSVSMEDLGVLAAADSPPVATDSAVPDTVAVEPVESPAQDAEPEAINGESAVVAEVTTVEGEAAASTTENGVEAEASEKVEEQAEPTEIVEDEHAEHATIAEVTESVNPADTKEEKIEDVIAKIKSMMACEIVEVLESGEILVLPKGWSTRASKTHGGKTYYVSPYGQTQWLRPPMKTNIGYKWVHEIEVTFGDGRLGLNLKQISSEPGQPFSDLLVHIAEIYKLGNGMASPAEIYNWSVKPEKRLHVGMRMTAINGIPLTGCTYSDILDRINRLPRPLRIKFADITRGIVGRVKEEPLQEETEEEKEARLTRTRQTDLRMEYLQVLVAHELRLQVWKVSKGRMQKKEQELKKKDEILTAQINAMMEYQSLLEKETESLVQETANLNQMIEQLNQQEAGAVPSPEVAKTPALQERNVALDKEVTDGMKENEELRQERVQLEEALDAVQKELDLYGGDFDDGNGRDEIDVFSSAFLGTIIDRGSLDRDAENAREILLMKIIERRRQLDLDMCEEAEEIRALETELVQLRRQMANVDSSARREEDLISGDKPPQLISLEVKVETLQKNLHETVTAMAAAAKEGNRARLDNLSIRRTGLKEELRKALDDVQKFEAEFNVRSSLLDRRLSVGSSLTPQSSGRFSLMSSEELPVQGGSDTANLHDRLAAVRSDLHDTVMQLTRAASSKDTKLMKELSGRRLQLKDEVKSIQEEYQMITRESMALPPLPPRASLDRNSMDRILIGDVPRDRSNSRSSSISTTSHASLAMSVDSNANYAPASSAAGATPSSKPTERISIESPRPNAMPVIGGQLMKHPSHSNEKGMFGNMSLRGVRERYCKLDGSGALLYYKRKSDREPRGSIPLNDPALEVVYAKNEAKSTEFSICTPTHQNKFVAKTRGEMMKWIEAIETTHAMVMERRSVTSQGARSSSTKENTLRRQESVVSNEDNGRASNGGLAPAAMELAMAADGRGSRGSMSVRDSSSSAAQQHRATLGF